MFIALALLLSIAALMAVAYPIVANMRQDAPAVSSAFEELDELLARRDAAFQALRDLGFDRQVGKITDEDFQVFEANLKQVAADTLRDLDAWEARTDDDLDLEQEIAARRAALATSGRACPACGHPAATDDAFCAKCGQPLTQKSRVAAIQETAACPHCGRPFEPGDRFCAGCGQALPAAEVVAQ